MFPFLLSILSKKEDSPQFAHELKRSRMLITQIDVNIKYS